MNMRREVREEWVRRLRSGDYVQGFGRLRTDRDGTSRYCCLGVLCEVAVEAGVVSYDAERQAYYDPTVPEPMIYGGVLPSVVSEWAGLTEEVESGRVVPVADPIVIVPVDATNVEHNLSRLNDAGTSFDEVARFIEAQL